MPAITTAAFLNALKPSITAILCFTPRWSCSIRLFAYDTGLFKMLFHREDRRLLGVHAIGTGATELIHIGQAVLGLGGGIDYFLQTVFNYPTLAECYKVAALDASNKLRD